MSEDLGMISTPYAKVEQLAKFKYWKEQSLRKPQPRTEKKFGIEGVKYIQYDMVLTDAKMDFTKNKK